MGGVRQVSMQVAIGEVQVASRVCILFLDDPPVPGSGEVVGVLRKL